MQEPLMRVAEVCRDEGVGEMCMRGTVATKAIRVRVQNQPARRASRAVEPANVTAERCG